MSLVLASREPNAVGEALRALTFPGHGVNGGIGCYTDFDVRPDAAPLAESDRAALVALAWCDLERLDPAAGLEISDEEAADIAEDNARAQGFEFESGSLRVEVAWFWDGDGWLFFRVFGPEGFLYGVVNNDCKKDYNWRAFHLPAPLPSRAAGVPAQRCGACGSSTDADALVLTGTRPGRHVATTARLCGACAASLIEAFPVLAPVLDRERG